jgi:hypothetical protein
MLDGGLAEILQTLYFIKLLINLVVVSIAYQIPSATVRTSWKNEQSPHQPALSDPSLQNYLNLYLTSKKKEFLTKVRNNLNIE